jgi:signal transduction histidine kinase
MRDDTRAARRPLKRNWDSMTAAADLLPELLASPGVGVAYLDRDLRLRRWNRSWGDCVGVSSAQDESLMEKSLSELMPSAAPTIQAAVPRLLEGETLYLDGAAFLGHDRIARHDMILIPLMREEGVEGFLHLLVDVGERAEAREALERSVLSCRRELSALRDVMSVAAESLELREVLNRLLDHVLRMMKSRVGVIHLFDEQRITLRLAASRRVPKRILAGIEAVEGPFDPTTWPTGEREPYVLPEIAERLRQSVTQPEGQKRAPYVGVPVRSGGETLGLISVVGRLGREFDDGDTALLTSIADQIGVVVENARLHRQAEQLAVVRERERLARELHDSVTQSLYSLTLLAEASQRLLGGGDPERAMEYTGRLGEIAQQALKEMRLLVYQLRPLVLKREGLVGALQQRLDAVEKRAGVDARLLVEGTLDLPAPVEEGLYRIAQEALNNALKHAGPRLVSLRIEADDERVRLQVEDDGRGFELAAVRDKGGMGLTSMRERAERMGGSFSLTSTPGKGTTVQVDVEVGP